MDSSASRLRLEGENTDRLYAFNPHSKLKTYGFALAIIVGIGGLAVGGVGVAGYIGAISSLNQVQAIIMMAVGSGGGALLFTVGAIGLVKIIRQESIHRIDTQGRLVYGADAWRIWGVEVLDAVPPAPEVNWDDNDPYFNKAYRDNYVLLYIPQRIQVGGEEKDLTLQTLREVSGGPFGYFSEKVTEQFGGSTSPGWVLVSKTVIPESRYESYEAQIRRVEANEGFRIPQAKEAIALNLMIFVFTNEQLYGDRPLTYNRCIETIDDAYPVVVGGFGSKGLAVHNSYYAYNLDLGQYGVAALRKF